MKKTLLFLAAVLTIGMAAKAQTAFSEDFQSGTLPTGWTTIADELVNYNSNPYNQFGQSWEVTQVSEDGNFAAISISYTDPEGNDCDRWLITPAITVPSSGYFLTANIWGRSTSYPEKVKVMISTTGTNKTDFTQVLDVVMDGTTYSNGWNPVMVNLDSYAGQNIYIAFVNHGDGFYTFVDDVKVKIVPANGISAVSASAPTWTAQNSNANVSLTVRNTGSAALAAFDVTYTVNGGDEQTLNVTGVDVAPFTNYTYTFPVQMTTLGVALVNITVSNPNNDTDADESDNSTSCETNVYDPATTTQRTSLLEHFTTAKCQYCPGGHDRLEQAMNGFEDRICWVAHHVGFNTDDMTISESNQIINLFNTTSTWAPAMTLDRNGDFAIDAEEGGVVGSVGDVSDIVAQFTDATSTPAYVTVELSNLNYDPQSRQLSVTVSGSFVSDFAGTEPRLSLYITQDGIYGVQADYATQSYIQHYEHNHVIRACVSNVWGDQNVFTSTTAGSTYSKTYTYTLPTKFSANKCRLIAFVNDYGPDMMHRTVANATKSGYLMTGDDPTTGIGDVQAGMEVITYPNPTTEMVYVTAEGTIRSFEMVDAMGRKVMGQENLNSDILELNVRSLAAGIYFITITTDRGTAVQRVSVTK